MAWRWYYGLLAIPALLVFVIQWYIPKPRVITCRKATSSRPTIRFPVSPPAISCMIVGDGIPFQKTSSTLSDRRKRHA